MKTSSAVTLPSETAYVDISHVTIYEICVIFLNYVHSVDPVNGSHSATNFPVYQYFVAHSSDPCRDST